MFEKIHKKMVAIGVGVAMGMSMSISPMAPARHAEAAIAVIDQKNIAEAIEMVNNAVKILTEAQKQYLLLVANTKKLDIGALTEFLGTQDENLKILSDLYKGYQSFNSEWKSTWNGLKSDFEKIKNGQITLFDIYKMGHDRASQTESTIKDASTTVMHNQEANQKIMERSKKLAEQSMKAEGQLQQQQISTQAVTNQTDATIQGNNALNTIVMLQTEELMRQETDREYARAVANMYIEAGQNAWKGYDASKNLYYKGN